MPNSKVQRLQPPGTIERLYGEADQALSGNVVPFDACHMQRHEDLVEDVAALLNYPPFSHIVEARLRDFLKDVSDDLIELIKKPPR